MPVWEIAIKGKFVTGTTIANEEQAKETCQKLLENKLAEAGISDEKAHGLFQWIPESVEAER
ncbi:unnamed protein product, partial [marine sediment metagenome]